MPLTGRHPTRLPRLGSGDAQGVIACAKILETSPGGSSVAYGYRIFQVELGKRRAPSERYDFDNVGLHTDGAQGLFRDALKALIDSSTRDDDRLTYFGVDAVQHGQWSFLVDASNGQFGRVRRVRDTNTNADGTPIGASDAVLDDLPLLLIVPSYGKHGFIVAATAGRSNNAFPFVRALENHWKDRGLVLKLTTDMADRTAWATYLGQTNIDVTHVELIQSSIDGTRPTFGTPGHVSRARVTLTLADSLTKKTVIQRVRDKVLNNKKLALTGAFGMSLNDSDFDDYRVLYVQDGRQKALSISNDFPHFIYPLDGTTPPTAAELAAAAVSDVEYLMGQIGMNFPSDWLPTKLDKLTP